VTRLCYTVRATLISIDSEPLFKRLEREGDAVAHRGAVSADTWLEAAPLEDEPLRGVFSFLRRLRYAVVEVVMAPRWSIGTTLRAAWPV
jgi:hypothetical protein